MQWYAFHKEPAGGVDAPGGLSLQMLEIYAKAMFFAGNFVNKFMRTRSQKERLLKIFEGWCDNVIDLLLATDEDAILRRDIYDCTPIFTWGKGRVTLLGDSVHAMQPNMGQGGCMAIEAAMRAQHFRSRNLRLQGPWKWPMAEFAEYNGVSDSCTKLRYLLHVMNVETPTK